jgi:hypothetical protein
MHIPQTDATRCAQDGCNQWVLTVRVPGKTRKAVGQTRIVNREEDTMGDTPREQYFLSVVAGTYQGVPEPNPARRAGVLAAGHKPHLLHAKTCQGRRKY